MWATRSPSSGGVVVAWGLCWIAEDHRIVSVIAVANRTSNATGGRDLKDLKDLRDKGPKGQDSQLLRHACVALRSARCEGYAESV
jgi:hypothetical protein